MMKKASINENGGKQESESPTGLCCVWCFVYHWIGFRGCVLFCFWETTGCIGASIISHGLPGVRIRQCSYQYIMQQCRSLTVEDSTYRRDFPVGRESQGSRAKGQRVFKDEYGTSD
ncbi:uncharacterized protein [Prorops nasuta]|uniref:uncharacterized protein isoform X2 n=1 Tax=Prorops nasuta TaxID=863751 RepID=UPI0034CD5445